MADDTGKEGKSDAAAPVPKSTFSADGVAKWIAVASALIAAGQAGSTWISGYWEKQASVAKLHQEIELQRVKADQDLRLEDLKERSELAKTYLTLIFGKDTREEDRMLYLSAMSKLEGHPLRVWAAERYDNYIKTTEERLALARKQLAAAEIRDEMQRTEAQVVLELDELNARMNSDLVRLNPVTLEATRLSYLAKARELGEVRANIALAVIRTAAGSLAAATNPDLPADLRAQALNQGAGAVFELAERITPALLAPLFSAQARERIERDHVFLKNALVEFKVADPRIAAAIIATIATEDPFFDQYEEPESMARGRDGKFGNTEPGDGLKFRGRGYIGLTGRPNYSRMSERLGLGRQLIENPELAKSPEIASRIAVRFMLDGEPRLTTALDAGDLAAVRRVVTGGTHLVKPFSDRYEKVLEVLTAVKP